MAAITLDIPDNLARYAAENGVFTPEWIAFVIKTSLDKLRKSQNAPETGDAGRKIAAKADVPQKDPLLSRLRGCYAYTGDTLEAYFERKRADKEHELALEERQQHERWREAIEWLTGCCKDYPGSVDEFLADCRAEKERELAAERLADERYRKEERNQYANLCS